ncbi:MAG: SAM-dependent methyltransferase [Chloroflexi bacterium]|nr:SAM-dependent methyltransferase [Chloroflexota bacterium]MCC6896046.1 methyltransferase [Anaerolineae bacterium]
MTDNYREMLQQAALDEATFVHMTFKGEIGGALPWRMVNVRPVQIKGSRHLQFSHFTAKQDITKNYAGDEAINHLRELLALPFHSIHLRTTLEELNVQITKKGKAILHRSAPIKPHVEPVEHDRWKDWPIPASLPDPFLQKIGIQTSDGRIRADMQDKFAQINEFLKLLDHTGALTTFDHSPIHILDCGAGSAHLTFATYHYLNNIRQIPANLSGVDTNAELMARSNTYSHELGLGDACFYASPIIQHVPEHAPDIVLALHACDTATDEALALGVKHGAGIIMTAPCCHKHLHQQLESRAPFEPVMRHGILKQRMGDILTDSFRALLLRIMGYKTDVVEFISSEHTGRNLMIRAVKKTAVGEAAFIQEYNELKAFWGVTPYLETLLGERLMLNSILV